MGLQTLFERLSGTFYRKQFNKYRTDGVREYCNIVYDETSPKVCRLDVYRKTLLGKLPVILFIHGGISVSLKRQHRKAFCRNIAAKGVAVLNIDYGTAPRHAFPAQIKQALSAINWAAKHSDKYGLDLQNLIIGGDGSGAFLGASLCCALTNKDYADALGIITDCPTPKGCAFFCGVYDFPLLVAQKTKLYRHSNFISALIGMDIYKDETLKSFPYYNSLKLAEDISAFPPVFFSHSVEDKVFVGQGELLKKRLAAAEVPYWEFCALEAYAPHIWNMELTKNEAKACNDAFGDFVKSVCGQGIMNAKYDI